MLGVDTILFCDILFFMKRTMKFDFNQADAREEFSGAEPKNWVKLDDGETEYLFKYDCEFENTVFGEVFISALCQELGIKCVEAFFGIGKTKSGRIKRGCLIKSYNDDEVRENISYYRVREMLQRDWTVKTNGVRRRYTPDNIFEDVKDFAGDKCIVDPSIRQDLAVMALFDYLTAQLDRHSRNIEFLTYKKDGQLHLRLAPMFDNGRCFAFADYLTSSILDQLEQRNPVLVMDQYLCEKDDEFCSNVYGIAKELETNQELRGLFDKITKFDMEHFLASFISTTGEKIDEGSSDDNFFVIVETWKRNVRNLQRAIQHLQDPTYRSYILNNAEMRRREDVATSFPQETHFYENYYYDKKNGLCSKPLSEYLREDHDYRQQIEDWKSLKSDTLKSIDDFPLLKPRVQGKELQDLMQEVRMEQHERRKILWENQKTVYVPDFITLDYLQDIKNAKENNGDIIDVGTKCDERRSHFDKKCDAWVLYGDDFGPMPTINDMCFNPNRKYDDDVLEVYIRKCEAYKQFYGPKYDAWLESVGKVEYAKSMRTHGKSGD